MCSNLEGSEVIPEGPYRGRCLSLFPADANIWLKNMEIELTLKHNGCKRKLVSVIKEGKKLCLTGVDPEPLEIFGGREGE